MTITARVVEDSISEDGARLTTLSLEYINFIHPQVMTHRDKSRGVASNRAIPARKMRRWVADDMAMPVYWGANKPGMVAGNQLEGWRLWSAKRLWRLMGRLAIAGNWGFEKIGLHKEVANRVLGPYSHTKVVFSATEWDNMFLLRDADDAQHEIQDLAIAMRDAMNASVPRLVIKGEWHLPYITPEERLQWALTPQLQASVARCARVSYVNHEGKVTTLAEDVGLYDRLSTSGHMSPFEHQATPTEIPLTRSGNFIGWSQYRKMIPNECRSGYSKLKRWNVIRDGKSRIVVPI
jgi:hypothetical protein